MNELKWKGSPRQESILERLLIESEGRLILLSGERGSGKTTLLLTTLARMYGKQFLFSPNFQFFRIDDYALKLAYYLSQAQNPTTPGHLFLWGLQFLLQYSQLLYLGEIKTSTIIYHRETMPVDQFRSLLFDFLHNGEFPSRLLEDKNLQDILTKLSEEVSAKKSIPIAFIREVINFHTYTTDSVRFTFIGGFENATVEAQNASLKLFEEMPSSSRIIIHTNEKDRILPTILSRSVVLSLPLPSRQTLQEIFALPSVNATTSYLHIRENLYHEQREAENLAKEFLGDLAFRIQKSGEIFEFIKKVTKTQEITLAFLDALVSFLHNQWLHRQNSLRNTTLPTSGEAFPFIAHTSEIKEWSDEILRINTLLAHSTIQSSYLLTDLLIRMSRWIQKRRIS